MVEKKGSRERTAGSARLLLMEPGYLLMLRRAAEQCSSAAVQQYISTSVQRPLGAGQRTKRKCGAVQQRDAALCAAGRRLRFHDARKFIISAVRSMCPPSSGLRRARPPAPVVRPVPGALGRCITRPSLALPLSCVDWITEGTGSTSDESIIHQCSLHKAAPHCFGHTHCVVSTMACRSESEHAEAHRLLVEKPLG